MNNVRQVKAAAHYIKTNLMPPLLKKSFYEFFKFFWDYTEDRDLIDNWHIEYICGEAQKIGERVIAGQPKEHDLILNVPPGSTKSRIMSIAFPVWLWINKPSLNILCVSYSGDLALEFAYKRRDMINSEIFQEMFPGIRLRVDRATIATYQNNHGGTHYSRGLTGQITGVHADIVLADDPMSVPLAHSKAERERINRNFFQALSTRKRKKENTPMVLIMQRLHEGDTTGEMLKKKKTVKHICLPGRVSDKVNPPSLKKNYTNGLLDPLMLSEATLIEMKEDLGSAGFAAQIGQDPQDSDNKIYMPHWWMFYEYLPHDIQFVIQSWDTAYKEGEENDYSVCMTYGMNMNGIYGLDRFKNKLITPDLEREMIKQYEKHKPNIVLIEDASSGQSLLPSLKRKTRIPLRGVKPMNKVVRANAVSPIIERGLVYLPKNADWVDDFISEHSSFPNGTHDDQVDASNMGIQAIFEKFERYLRRSKRRKTEVAATPESEAHKIAK
ncbi:MAG: phage terminase large subunit [Bacteroidota bacterium]